MPRTTGRVRDSLAGSKSDCRPARNSWMNSSHIGRVSAVGQVGWADQAARPGVRSQAPPSKTLSAKAFNFGGICSKTPAQEIPARAMAASRSMRGSISRCAARSAGACWAPMARGNPRC